MSVPALRVDVTTGVEERLEHVRTSRGQLYTWTARPPEARSCVLVCSSIFGDFSANYHRERLLGRALLSEGIGVVRFHYTGEGNSQGERSDMTFSSLCDDAAAVLDHAESLGFTEFAALGTRMGGLIASATVARTPTAPLVLWEPVVDPLRFIADAERARRMSLLAQGAGRPTTSWREELKRNGVLDLVGYEVYPPLVESLENVELVSTLGSLPRRVFIVRFRGKARGADPLADQLVDRGFSVQTGIFDLSESWWFHDGLVPESGDLITATTAWLTTALSEAA